MKAWKVLSWTGGAVVGAVLLNELGGRPVPFLRWSFLRMALGMKNLMSNWQVGDGREEALARYVEARAKAGDVDDVIRVIDEFAYRQSFLINVGDEKGAVLDRAVRRVGPKRVLELGTYCGYGALRLTRAAGPAARVVSVEFSEANAGIARRVLAHAGVSDRVTVVHGTLGDDGETLRRLEAEHGFAPGTVDFVFLDHDKTAYVTDLERILSRGWLRPGAVVMADNVRFPGIPEYRELMKIEEGRRFSTQTHTVNLEYQSLFKDWMLESEYLGPSA